MNEPPPPEKRIVSRGTYVKAQSKRGALVMAATGLGLITVGCGLIALVALGFCVFSFLCGSLEWKRAVELTVPLCTVRWGIGAILFYYGTKATLKTAKKINPGVPLTRANTSDLPAPDSLVRASEEPVKEQEAVLLRAAIERTDKHEEQLVRAVIGPE